MNSHNAIPGTSSGPPAIPTQAAPIDVFTMTLHVRYLINRFTDPLQMSHFNGKFSDSVMLLLVVMMNHESASSFDRVKIKMMVTIKITEFRNRNRKLETDSQKILVKKSRIAWSSSSLSYQIRGSKVFLQKQHNKHFQDAQEHTIRPFLITF